MTNLSPVEILLVDDDEGDVILTKRALDKSKIKINLHVCHDGVEALQFLRKQDPYSDAVRPDLILLDLNMPRKDGKETLEEIRTDDTLKEIPIVILTTSSDEEDIAKTYKLGCNCYVTKPVDIEQLIKILNSMSEFWFTIVKLPSPK